MQLVPLCHMSVFFNIIHNWKLFWEEKSSNTTVFKEQFFPIWPHIQYVPLWSNNNFGRLRCTTWNFSVPYVRQMGCWLSMLLTHFSFVYFVDFCVCACVCVWVPTLASVRERDTPCVISFTNINSRHLYKHARYADIFLCVSFRWWCCECIVLMASEVCLPHSQSLRVNQKEMVAGEQQQQAEWVGHGSFFSRGRGRPTGDFDG